MSKKLYLKASLTLAAGVLAALAYRKRVAILGKALFRSEKSPCEWCGGTGKTGAFNAEHGEIAVPCRTCRGKGIREVKVRRFEKED